MPAVRIAPEVVPVMPAEGAGEDSLTTIQNLKEGGINEQAIGSHSVQQRTQTQGDSVVGGSWGKQPVGRRG